MRMMTLVVATALVAMPAFAKPMSPLARETAIWQAFKNKQANAFGAMFAPNYVGIYAEGPATAATDMQSLKNSKIASFKIANFNSRMIDAEDMLMTYSVDVKGTMGKTDVSGRYWAASLWHRTGNNWLTAYHTEVKAK